MVDDASIDMSQMSFRQKETNNSYIYIITTHTCTLNTVNLGELFPSVLVILLEMSGTKKNGCLRDEILWDGKKMCTKTKIIPTRRRNASRAETCTNRQQQKSNYNRKACLEWFLFFSCTFFLYYLLPWGLSSDGPLWVVGNVCPLCNRVVCSS